MSQGPSCGDNETGDAIQTKPIADRITPLVQRQTEEEEEEEPLQAKFQSMQVPFIQRQEEEEEEPIQAKSLPGKSLRVTPGLQGQIQSLRGGGSPLNPFTRSFFEPRFGSDFSRVRVHTGSQAAGLARSLNANAFTRGKDVVFGSGQYSPGTSSGRRLLAHELTHVVQQQDNVSKNKPKQIDYYSINDESKFRDSISSADEIIQRSCGSAAIGQPTGCTFNEREVTRPRYLFRVNCDEFRIGHEEDLRRDAGSIANGETVEIHGLASWDGDPTYNRNLSCARALAAKRVIESVLVQRGVTATLLVYNHGRTRGNALLQRSVVVIRRASSPPTPPTPPAPPRAAGPFLDLQIACVIDGGGCTNPANIPVLDTHCRNQTGYGGTPVNLSDLVCGTPGLGVARSLILAYPNWLSLLHTHYPCPCTRAEAENHADFSWDPGSALPGHHPGSDVCYRSDSIASVPGTYHGQQCCYTDAGMLITHGSGAGTPDVWHWWDSVSRHQRIDYKSFTDLNRDWRIYNRFWEPDRGVNCGPITDPCINRCEQEFERCRRGSRLGSLDCLVRFQRCQAACHYRP